MKKVLIIMIFAMAAFVFTGCSDEGFDSAQVKWDNQSTTNVNDIQWVNQNNSPNQTWTGQTVASNDTAFKNVTLETGKGLCFDDDGFTEYVITINSSYVNYTLSDGESESLEISEVTAK